MLYTVWYFFLIGVLTHIYLIYKLIRHKVFKR